MGTQRKPERASHEESRLLGTNSTRYGSFYFSPPKYFCPATVLLKFRSRSPHDATAIPDPMDAQRTMSPVVRGVATKPGAKPGRPNFQYMDTLERTPGNQQQPNARKPASNQKKYGSGRRREEQYNYRDDDVQDNHPPPAKRPKVMANPESIHHADPFVQNPTMVPESQNPRSNDSWSNDGFQILPSHEASTQRTNTPQKRTNGAVTDNSMYQAVEKTMDAKTPSANGVNNRGRGRQVAQVVILSQPSKTRPLSQHSDYSISEQQQPLTQRKDQFSIKGASNPNRTIDAFVKTSSPRRERSATVDSEEVDELAQGHPDYPVMPTKVHRQLVVTDMSLGSDIPSAKVKPYRNTNRSSPSKAEDSRHLISCRWLHNIWGECTLRFEEQYGKKQIRLEQSAHIAKQHVIDAEKVHNVYFAEDCCVARLTGSRDATTKRQFYCHLEFPDLPSLEWFRHKVSTRWNDAVNIRQKSK
jgi:hypothetical protein